MATTTVSPAFADEIRDARRATGLSQRQLAHLSGVSASSIQSWVPGVRVPSNSYALRLIRSVLADLNDERHPAQGAPANTTVKQDRHASP
jgi:DNA-binding transcriptional regulator YiaG